MAVRDRSSQWGPEEGAEGSHLPPPRHRASEGRLAVGAADLADLELAADLGSAVAADLPEVLTLLHRDDVVGERRDGARHLVGLGLCGVEPAREAQERERGQGQRLQLEHAVLLPRAW